MSAEAPKCAACLSMDRKMMSIRRISYITNVWHDLGVSFLSAFIKYSRHET